MLKSSSMEESPNRTCDLIAVIRSDRKKSKLKNHRCHPHSSILTPAEETLSNRKCHQICSHRFSRNRHSTAKKPFHVHLDCRDKVFARRRPIGENWIILNTRSPRRGADCYLDQSRYLTGGSSGLGVGSVTL